MVEKRVGGDSGGGGGAFGIVTEATDGRLDRQSDGRGTHIPRDK
jgi:hypothetical protein